MFNWSISLSSVLECKFNSPHKVDMTTRSRLIIGDTWMRSNIRSYRQPEEILHPNVTLFDAFIRTLICAGEFVGMNPALAALTEELNAAFGMNKTVRCCISLGLGPLVTSEFGGDSEHLNEALQVTESEGKADLGEDSAPFDEEEEPMRSPFETTIRIIETDEHADRALTQLLGDGYIRFDMKDYLALFSEIDFQKIWGPVMKARHWKLLQILEKLSELYMRLPEQVEKLTRCAELLKDPRGYFGTSSEADVDDIDRALSAVDLLSQSHAF